MRRLTHPTVILLALLVAFPLEAANRVGDADNDGDVDTLDAARVQARVLGTIDEFSISPLALADADGDLDIADLMLVAQAASGARTISGPGGWLNFIDPASAFATSGGPPVARLWGVYSSFYGVAENTDGMDTNFSKLPGAAQSTVAPATADVAGLGALTYLLPLNTTGVAQNVTVRLTLPIQNSSGGALMAYTRNTIVQVAPSVCGNNAVEGGEQCDDGNTSANDGCGPTCQAEFCGDAIVQTGEACDDGVGGTCFDDCSGSPVCGDGVTNGTEECDDFGKCDGGQLCETEADCTTAGSANCLPRSGDGCTAACLWEFCGDGVVNNDTAPYGLTVNGMWMDVGGGVRQLKDAWSGPDNIFIPDEYNYGMTVRTDTTLAVLQAVAGNPVPTGQLVDWAIDRYIPVGPGEAATCNGTGLGPNGVTYTGSSTCARYHSVLRGSASLSETLSGSTIVVEGTLVNDGFYHWVTNPPTPLPPEVQTLYAYGEFDATTRLGTLRLGLQAMESEACDDGPGGACLDDCSAVNVCGDGIVFGGETCDDGPGGACFDDCSGTNVCGDSTAFGNEICDDGAPEGPGLCLNDCSGLQVCGDGVTNGTEGCDDFGKCDNGAVCNDESDCTAVGSANCLPRSGDGCTAACVLEYCGDGIVNNDTTAYGVTVNGMWMDVGGGVRELKDGGFDPGNILIPDAYNYGMTVRTDATLAVLEAVAGNPTPTGQFVGWAIDRYDPVGPGEAATCNGTGLGPNGVTYSGAATCERYHSVLRGAASLTETLSGSTLVVEGTLVNDGFFHWVTTAPTPLPPEVQTLYVRGEFDATTRVGTLRLAFQPIEMEACDDGALNGTGEGNCLADCTSIQTCGDGVTNGTEGCDDFGKCDNGAVCAIEQDCIAAGSLNCLPRSGDGCNAACVLEFCGDGIINNNTAPYGTTVNGMWMDVGGGTREFKDSWFDPGNILIPDEYNYGMTVRTDSTLAVLEQVAGNPTPTGQLADWTIDRYTPTGPGETTVCNGTGLGPNGLTYTGSSVCIRKHSVLRGTAFLSETPSGSTVLVTGTLVNDGFFHWVTNPPTPLPPEVQTLYVEGTFDTATRLGTLRLALQPIESETCDDGNNIDGDGCNSTCTGP